jgi:hypothetical protein
MSDPESLVFPLHQSPSDNEVKGSHDLPHPRDFGALFRDGRRVPLQADIERFMATVIRKSFDPAERPDWRGYTSNGGCSGRMLWYLHLLE